MTSSPSKIKIGRHTIEISNQDKVFFPEDTITKGDLINYYAQVASVMIPYTKKRPISMQRFPHGIQAEGFYQKDASDYFPQWITIEPIKKQDNDIVNYVVINNAATLVYLANQACITPHIWLSRHDKLRNPDKMIFDLDPAEKTNFADVQWASQQLRSLLEDELHLSTFVMTTGSRGAHIVIPIKRLHDFDYVRTFAQDIAHVLEHRHPEKLTTALSKQKRNNRIFIDWLRNSFGATSVAPYAVRAIEGAPVAMPLPWKLFETIKSAQTYTIKNVSNYLKKNGDAWKNINTKAVSLTKARKKLDTIMKEEKS